MARNKIDVDEELEEKFDFRQLVRLGHYVGPYKKDLIVAIIIMLFSSALSMLQPLFLKNVMDVIDDFQKGKITDNSAIAQIVVTSILMLIVTLIVVVILKIKIKLTTRVGQNEIGRAHV